jgi:hypothetical protein
MASMAANHDEIGVLVARQPEDFRHRMTNLDSLLDRDVGWSITLSDGV